MVVDVIDDATRTIVGSCPDIELESLEDLLPPPRNLRTGAERILEHEPDVVTIDGYDIGQHTVDQLTASGATILSIDDDARSGRHRADLHLDQNAGASPIHQRLGRQLLGSSYLLLRESFLWCDEAQERAGVLVSLGGSNHGDGPHALADITPTEMGRDVTYLRPSVRANASPRDMYAGVELAVVAAGSTVWELARTGTPMALVTLAENQVPIAQHLDRQGCATYLGPLDELDRTVVVAQLQDLLTDENRRSEMAQRASSLVDGRGADRAVAHLRSTRIDVRQATMADGDLLLEWRNEPEVRRWSFSTDLVDRGTHMGWLTRELQSPQPLLFVGELNGEPIGQVRFSECDLGFEIGISLARSTRGKGLASPLILAGISRVLDMTNASRIIAQIKPENERSIAAFELAGFVEVAKEGDSAPICMEWSDPISMGHVR